MSKEKRINCDFDKCNRCRICEVECAITREESFDLSLSRIRVVATESTQHMTVACQLCEDPPCVSSCPRDALRQSELGTILVNEDKCIGCRWCINACDFGAIIVHPTMKIAICDLCNEERNGGDPPCVKSCPYGALTFSSKEELSLRSRRKIVDQFVQSRYR